MEDEAQGGRSAAPKGTCVRASGKDGPQVVRTGRHRIGPEEIETFLDHLAATGNATLAAELAGFSREAFYHRRRRDPALYERWRAVLAQSVLNIEELVLRTAEALLEGRPPPADSPIRSMTMADAIAIVKMYRPVVSGQGKAPGWRPRPRSLDEMRDSILAKLAAIERHRLDRAKRDGGGPEAG